MLVIYLQSTCHLGFTWLLPVQNVLSMDLRTTLPMCNFGSQGAIGLNVILEGTHSNLLYTGFTNTVVPEM